MTVRVASRGVAKERRSAGAKGVTDEPLLRPGADAGAVRRSVGPGHLLRAGAVAACLFVSAANSVIAQKAAARPPASSDKTFRNDSASPGGTHTLVFIGDLGEEGTLYLGEPAGRNVVLRGRFGTPPVITWVTEDLAEIGLFTPNQGFAAQYYDCTQRRLSVRHDYPIAVAPKADTVVCVTDGAILFRRMFAGTLLYRHALERFDARRFISICEFDATFDPQGTFTLATRCGDDARIPAVVTIPRSTWEPAQVVTPPG